MLGVRVERVKGQPTVKAQRSAPGPRPKEMRIDKRVFLFRDLWERLSEVAEFHSDTFKAADRAESVSRNDIIEDFLEWAEERYWADKGGKPVSDSDRAKKLEAFAERLKKEMDAGAAQTSENNTNR